MAYYNNRREEPLPSEDINTWECTSENCNGWMRKAFSSVETPACPFCGSLMESGIRHTHPLQNNAVHKE